MFHQIPLSSVKGMDGESVRGAMVKFDSFLSVPDSLVLPQCLLMLSTRLRDATHRQSMELVCNAYRDIFEAVHNPANLYSNPNYIAQRTPEQVTALLLS